MVGDLSLEDTTSTFDMFCFVVSKELIGLGLNESSMQDAAVITSSENPRISHLQGKLRRDSAPR